jgi:hypothetical protein
MAFSRGSIVESRPREQWVDNLRVIVIAGVIVLHAATVYLVAIAGWYYQERTTSNVWLVLLSGPALIGATFALGPPFLLAGWFSARSAGPPGPGGFAGSRLVRLGVPLVVFVLFAGRAPGNCPIFGLAGAAVLLALDRAAAPVEGEQCSWSPDSGEVTRR